MISRSVLEELIPSFEPPSHDLRSWYPELDISGEDPFHIHVELWCMEIQFALGNYFEKISSYSEFSELAYQMARDTQRLIGIGFFDKSEIPDEPRTIQDLAFGLVLYAGFPGRPPTEFPSLETGGETFPVFESALDFEDHGRLSNGRCSAVLADTNDAYFLTARHCVQGLSLGSTVDVDCPYCGARERTTLAKRGHVYLDVALLKRPTSNCGCSYYQTRQSAPGLRSLSVGLHDSTPSTSRKATIMQGIGTPSATINGARPQTFTTDLYSSAGASGCAISTGPAAGSTTDRMVGSYSGKMSIGTSGNTAVTRGFAHCADEALRLFQCNLVEGVF